MKHLMALAAKGCLRFYARNKCVIEEVSGSSRYCVHHAKCVSSPPRANEQQRCCCWLVHRNMVKPAEIINDKNALMKPLSKPPAATIVFRASCKIDQKPRNVPQPSLLCVRRVLRSKRRYDGGQTWLIRWSIGVFLHLVIGNTRRTKQLKR